MSRVEPNRNVYVGHRYVPKIMGEWDNSVSYEGLSIVLYQGGSYTSKKRVPAGIDIKNEEFWAITGNYNAQVDYYRAETERVAEDLLLKSDQTYVDTELGKKSDKTYVDTEIGKKSDKTYVDTEIGKKSDKTYVDTELDKKVNKGELVFNIDDYGAVGDDIKDNSDIINTLIQEINVSGGGTLFIPPGDYAVHSEIMLLANVDIMGSGRQSKIISKHDGIVLNLNKQGVILDPGITPLGGGGHVTNFSIIKHDSIRPDRTMTGTAVKLSSFTRGHLSLLYIRGFEKGIDTTGSSWSSSIDKCYMHANVYGIYLYGEDEEGNDPRVSGNTMYKTGFNGGTISRNEIQGNYFGIYFEAHLRINQLHSHGVWINGNIIESNYIRAIRHTYGTGTVHILNNYFEYNSSGVNDPVGGHVSPTINVVDNPDYRTDVKNVQADILLESNATDNISYNSGKVIIEGNEGTNSAPVFVALVNGNHSTIKENRISGLVSFFFTPLGVNVNPTNNMLIDNNYEFSTAENKHINMPSRVTLNSGGSQSIGNDLKVNRNTELNGGLISKSDFSVKGFTWTAKHSVSPEEDLKDIENDMSYIALVQSSEGYPTPNGHLTGFKRTTNNYSYTWQLFNRSSGDRVFRRHALSSGQWSEWVTLGTAEPYYTTVNRPENLPLYSRIFDTTLNKPIWKLSNRWVDSNGETV